MSYFPDLSPYAYGHRAHPGVVHVGWLDGIHEFSKGDVPAALIGKMEDLAKMPVELYRGFHVCEICRSAKATSNGEIRVKHGDVTYAAPIGIIHYIEAHGYRPPVAFLDAIEEAANHPTEPLSPSRGGSS